MPATASVPDSGGQLGAIAEDEVEAEPEAEEVAGDPKLEDHLAHADEVHNVVGTSGGLTYSDVALLSEFLIWLTFRRCISMKRHIDSKVQTTFTILQQRPKLENT